MTHIKALAAVLGLSLMCCGHVTAQPVIAGGGITPSVLCGDSSHALGWTGSAYNCQGITGSAAAGGSNTQVQYNNSAALAGITGFTSDGTSGIFASGNLKLSGASSGTSLLNAPATGGGTLTLPPGADTIAGIAATQTLTNKTISGSSNTLSNIANASLSNSTISGIALGNSLAALTSTDTTLTFSGSYSGGTARTVGLNLGNTNIWTGQQTFGAVLGGEDDQSGTTYTLVAADCGKTVAFSNGSAVTVTIPASIVPAAGTTCDIKIRQDGAGAVSVNGSAVSAATLVSAHSYTKTAAQHAMIGLELTTISATTTAVLTGDGA